MGALRARNGHVAPYRVTWWGIGNEIYGKWQLGHMPIEKYVDKHNRFAAAMRAADPKIKLIAVGATGPWSEAMMQHCADAMDLVSEHFDCQERHDLQTHVEQIPNQIRHKAAVHRDYRRRFAALKGKDIRIALDEWNTWYGPHIYGDLGTRYFLQDALGIAGHDRNLSAAAIERHRAAIGINNPNRAATGAEPLVNLGSDLAGPVVRREDFDDQVRSALKETHRFGFGDPLGANEGHIRRANRIGIVGDLEASFSTGDDAQLMLNDKCGQKPIDCANNSAMAKPGGRHHLNGPTKQFAPPQAWGLEQLVGRGCGVCGSHIVILFVTTTVASIKYGLITYSLRAASGRCALAKQGSTPSPDGQARQYYRGHYPSGVCPP